MSGPGGRRGGPGSVPGARAGTAAPRRIARSSRPARNRGGASRLPVAPEAVNIGLGRPPGGLTGDAAPSPPITGEAAASRHEAFHLRPGRHPAGSHRHLRLGQPQTPAAAAHDRAAGDGARRLAGAGRSRAVGAGREALRGSRGDRGTGRVPDHGAERDAGVPALRRLAAGRSRHPAQAGAGRRLDGDGGGDPLHGDRGLRLSSRRARLRPGACPCPGRWSSGR